MTDITRQLPAVGEPTLTRSHFRKRKLTTAEKIDRLSSIGKMKVSLRMLHEDLNLLSTNLKVEMPWLISYFFTKRLIKVCEKRHITYKVTTINTFPNRQVIFEMSGECYWMTCLQEDLEEIYRHFPYNGKNIAETY